MIIVCSQCHKKMRLNSAKYAGKKLSLTCRSCGNIIRCLIPCATKILVAHGEPEVCQNVLKFLKLDASEILTCSDAVSARRLLEQQSVTALLLDVALPGAFPFQLIDEIRRNGSTTKIILLPSVYNRTAYKRKPSSLYGADGYLELHHLSDRLIPLLHELAPELTLKSTPFCSMSEEGEERALSGSSDLCQQAEELARLLIADIALYQQEQIDLGIEQQDLEVRLAVELEEGRRMLARRIPQVELDKQDYLLSALMCFSAARQEELRSKGDDVHG